MRIFLYVLVISLLLITGCQSGKTEPQVNTVSELERRPLEAPFNEIIPSAEDLFITPYRTSEETISYPDGSVGHIRMFANESACYSSLSDEEKPESPSLVFNMIVYEYQDIEQANRRILEVKERKQYNDNDNELYATRVGLAPDDVAGYVIFWKEPSVEEIQGRETIFFKIDNYVVNCEVWIDDPPELEDGYFIPPDLHDKLIFAVQITKRNLESL